MNQFDFHYYHIFNKDLHKFNEDKVLLMHHYYLTGINENRICCEADFYKIYPIFDVHYYHVFNKDLHYFNGVNENKVLLMHHYHIHGKNENTISCE